LITFLLPCKLQSRSIVGSIGDNKNVIKRNNQIYFLNILKYILGLAAKQAQNAH